MALWADRLVKHEWKWVLALSLLGLALRIGYVLSQQPGFYFMDSLEYDRAARTFLETGHFDPKYYRLPLYPVFMAMVYSVFPSEPASLRLVQTFAGVLICLVVWGLARRLFGPPTALVALAGSVLFPVHIVLSGIEYPVLLGTLLIWLVLWALVAREQSESRSFELLLAAGLGAAVTAMLFEAGLVLGFFALLCVLGRRAPWQARLVDLAVLAILGVTLLGTWTLKMVRSDDFRPLVLKAGIHLPTAPGVDAPLWEGSGENLLSAKLAGLARNPGWTVRHFFREFFHFWNPYPDRIASADEKFRKKSHALDARMVVPNSLVGDLPRLLYAVGYSGLLFAAFLGAIAAFGNARGAVILMTWPVVLGLCYSPFFTQMRYRIPADPSFIIFGAYAVEAAIENTLWIRVIHFFKALWEGWKKIAEKIMVFWTFVLLLLLFVLIVGPIAILMKIFRKDPMHAPLAPGSFWALREKTREGMEECLRQF